MVLTEKETMLLNDLKTQEQLCIDKYERYAADACDRTLGTLFWDIGQVERSHLHTINQILQGTVPNMNKDASVPETLRENFDFKEKAMYNSMSEGEDKNTDAYLCQDALSMEKHVAGVYNTSVFEFTTQELRDILSHILKEEQNHGKRIYDYMSANGLYS